MKNKLFRLLSLLILIHIALGINAQYESFITIDNNEITLKIRSEMSEEQLQSLSESFQLDSAVQHAIRSKNYSDLSKSGDWKVSVGNDGVVVLVKPLEGKSFIKVGPLMVETNWTNPAPPPPASFGFNHSKLDHIYELEDGRTLFRTDRFRRANQVYLSGTFNNWSTMDLAMEKKGDFWEVALILEPGKHLYKFIADGNWEHDSDNRLKEEDEFDGFNSVYYRTNFLFELLGFTEARRVFLAGTFNFWDDRQCELEKTPEGWALPVYLREGTYGYKFIVDGNWMVDPHNPDVREDAFGNENSIVSFGPIHRFHLHGFSDANQVVLSGNFNNWSPNEFLMHPTSEGWYIDYVLPPGQYEYKFVVDGKWIIDPGNPLQTGEGDYINSLLFIEPNYTFYLTGYLDEEAVYLTGSFNNWAFPGYPMIRDYEGWILPVHLAKGKHLYKFVIRNEHFLDPDNPLWEPNEWGTGNSIIWID